MPNLRCERFGPFDIEELKEELGNLEFEYMMDLAPSKPPTVVRLCECKDEDYEGYHIRLFVGDYEYCVEEGNEAEDVKEMLETMSYETYAEQDLEGIPRFHNWYMALPGKSPYDPTYIEECKIRADAFFKEKEERKKLEEAAASAKAAEQVRIIADVLSKTALRSLSPPPHTPPPYTPRLNRSPPPSRGRTPPRPSATSPSSSPARAPRRSAWRASSWRTRSPSRCSIWRARS